MGARPSTFKKGGGGFLNGVDGTITGYRWTDEFNGEPFEPGKKAGGGDKFHSLFMELSARLDGADEDITQNLFAGGFDDFEISEDGLTLTSAAGDDQECSIGANTAAGKFLQSLVEAGFPEAKFSDDPNSVNVEPMVGTRVRFGQAQQLGKDGKPLKRIVKKGKFKGREFDNTTTIVEQVYETAKSGKAEKTGKATGKKAKDAEEDASDETPTSLATTFLVKVVKANKGKMAKAKVSMQLLKPENGLFKHPEREAIRKLLNSDKFLNTEDGWSYDEDKEIITVKVKAKADEDEDEDDE